MTYQTYVRYNPHRESTENQTGDRQAGWALRASAFGATSLASCFNKSTNRCAFSED